MSDIFFWIIALIMIALGAYTNFINWKMFFSARKAKEVFLKNHKDGKTERISKTRWIWFTLLAVLCTVIGFIIALNPDAQLSGAGRWSQVAVYFGLAIFSISLIPESLTDSKIVWCPDGFMYEDEYLRFKNINNIEIGNGFFKPTTVYMNGARQIAMPKAVAKWALAKWQEYKQSRQTRRKKGNR